MTRSLTELWRNRELRLSVIFGCWASAIALAPSLETKAIIAAPAVALPLAWWMLADPSRWLELFFAAALLLPPIPAPIGNTGMHPSLAIAAAGLFAGVAWLGKWRIPWNGLTAALVAFFAILLMSVGQAALHSGAEAAAGSFARVGLLAISIYVFFYTLSVPAGDGDRFPTLRRLFGMAVAAAAFACVDFYFQLPAPAGYGPQFIWLDSGIFRRAQGLFYEANTLGNFCAFFLTMVAVSLARRREESPVSRKALLTGGAVLFAALTMSYSRGSVANVLAGVIVLLWLHRRQVRWARLISSVAAFAAAAALITWKVFPAFAEIYWLRLSATTEFLFSATSGVLSGRVESWRTLLNWVASNPWQAMLGIGYKTLPYSDYLGAPVVADNMYLSLLVETGVLGVTALFWLNWAILRAAWRAARSPRNSFIGEWMLCFWAGEMTQMLFGDLLTYWRVLPIYFWVLALAVRE